MDMTRGDLLKLLIKFSIPLMLSGILQQLFLWVDAYIIGNIDSEASLAAIGSTGPLVGLIVSLIVGFASGIAIIIAQKFGEGKNDDIKKYLGTFSITIGVITIISTLLIIVFCEEILVFFDVPSEIFDLGKDYLTYYMLGVPFIGIYNIYASIVRGIGESKLPFYGVIISTIVNIILDLLLIGPFGMRTKGAAIATAISHAISAIYIVIASRKKYEIIKLKKSCFDLKILKEGAGFGIPVMVQSSCMAAGSIFLLGFLNSFGEATIAGIATAYRVDTIMLLPVVNLGFATTTIVAQNVGAGEIKRVDKTLLYSLLVTGGFSVALGILVIKFGGSVVSIFGLGQEALQVGSDFFIYLGPFYIIFGISTVFRSYMEGMGKVALSCAFTIISVISRVIFSYMLVEEYYNMSIALAEGFSWIVQLVLPVAFVVAFYINRHKIRLNKKR